MDIDTIDDFMVWSNSEIEFDFDLNVWDGSKLFGKVSIPRAINYRIPPTQILPLVII